MGKITKRDLISSLETEIESAASNLNTHKTSSDHDARYYTETETNNLINNLAGTGRTTETVKTNADNISNHISDNSKHTSVMTTRGDMIYMGASAPTRRSIGAVGQLLISNGADPIWSYLDNKNYIIDGNFQIAQVIPTVGTTISNPATNTYPVFDMWKTSWLLDGGTNPTILHSQEMLTKGDVLNSYYFYRISPSGAGSGYGTNSYYTVKQHIEHGVRNLCGLNKTVSISFYARSSIANKKLGVSLEQNYGTGGSPSATQTINGTAPISLTSSWTRYNMSFSTNSIVGKTFGTSNDDHLDLLFYTQWGATTATKVGDTIAQDWVGSGTVDICQCTLNAGSVALTFSPKSFQEELRACQRYFEKSVSYDVALSTSTFIGSHYDVARTTNMGYSQNVYFKVPKRTTPVVTTYSYSTLATNVTRDFNANADKRMIATDINHNKFILISDTLALTIGNIMYTQWYADIRF